MADPAWECVDWSSDFIDITGRTDLPPWLRTRVKMLWDDTAFYIGAELEEPHLWATLTEHDSVIFQDNDFEVFFDPNSDNCEYFEFEVNALGTTWDLFLPKPYRAGGSADNSWEIPGLDCKIGLKGTLNDPTDADQGWIVELSFPWSCFAERGQCSVPPVTGDTWRVNFSRVQWDLKLEEGKYQKIADRPEHNWVWSPQYAVDMHRPWHWGYVQFLGEESHPWSDPHHEERMLLHEAYMNWKESPESWRPADALPVRVQLIKKRFWAEIALPDGRSMTLDHDCRIGFRDRVEAEAADSSQ